MTKKRFLFAWELGAASGHIVYARALARQLVSRGAHCAFALRELHNAERLLNPALGDIWQAPFFTGAPPTLPRPSFSYASVLNQCGWGEATQLTGLVRAWRTLIKSSGCDLLIADHSPTAILAAKTLGVPVAAHGNGFSLPPIQHPFPPFLQVDSPTLIQQEANVLSTLNETLQRLNEPVRPSLQSLFDDVHIGLFSYRELDPYERFEGRFWGMPLIGEGQDVSWQQSRNPRIFGYLRPFSGFQELLSALSGLSAEVVLRVADVRSSDWQRYLRPGLTVIDSDVDMRSALRSADLCVSYSPVGTTTEMLLAGRPGLLVPDVRERELVAISANKLGAALVLPAHLRYSRVDYTRAINELLEDGRYRRNAKSFAERYADVDRSLIIPGWCDELIKV